VSENNGPAALYLVDATIYVFRAWFSIPDKVRDREGRPFNAVHGFSGFVAEFLKKAAPRNLAFCFDESLSSSFRNEIDPGYKANREAAPEDLKQQLRRCRAVCRAIGAVEMADPRYEADDLIGTLAARAGDAPLVIVTRDKDLAQLLRPGRPDQLWDFAADRLRGAEQIEAEYGIRPEQFADYLALVGDPVDNIIGVRGIGAKAAAALLRRFGDLDVIYASLDRIADTGLRGATRLRELLEQGRDAAFLARRLSVIHTEMPLPPLDTAWLAPPRAQVQLALGELGLSERLARRIVDQIP